MVRKDYYIVRMPSLERPPTQDYNEILAGRFFSTMASSQEVALRNIIWRSLREDLHKKVTYRKLSSNKRLDEVCMNVSEVEGGISSFDSNGKSVESTENDKYYTLINEIMKVFGVKMDSAKEVAKKYFDRRRIP